MFLGREHETRVVRELVTGLPQRGGALVVMGDPGIGKSALAALAVQFAVGHGVKVLSATGVPAESNLPYAGLHQLLYPLRDGIGHLPERQADAIRAAFGQSTGHVPDRFLVAVAVTDLLTAAAARQPLFVLVDDAHWLDPATYDVLTFLGRRIDAEPIVLLATARDGYQLPLLEAGLAELRLGGLPEAAARELLDAVAPGLTTAERREILGVALGNPLALTELSGGAGRPDMPAAGPGSVAITYRLEKAFGTRWGELPADTRNVLLVAALNEGGTLGETLDAAALIQGQPVTPRAVTSAIEARLVEAGITRLRFRHPLIRSAIEYRAGPSQLAAAHQALANVLEGHPDRRTWHRAAAALDPDEDVAADLDEAASRAERRAAISVAITALERAVELSVDPAARTGRLLRAAQLAFELGRPALVERFARSVPRTGLSLMDQARLELLEESYETRLTEGTDHIRYLIRLARGVAADGKADLALELLYPVAKRCWWTGTGIEMRLLVAETALELASQPLHPTLQSVLAFAAPETYGGLARDHIDRLAQDAGLDAAQLTHLGVAATVLGSLERSRALFAVAIPQLREQHRLGLLIRALGFAAFNAAYTCRWSDALAAADECARVAVDAGQRRDVAVVTAPRALVAAIRGDNEELERLASQAEPALLADASSSLLTDLQNARGVAALGEGNYDAAYRHLMRTHDPADKAFHFMLPMYHLADLADAASHSGHVTDFRALFAEIAAPVVQEPSPLVAVNIAFARAMLAREDADAEEQFQRALAGKLRHWPFYHGRLKLEYGMWLRQHNHAERAREHLQAARDVLGAVGARAWRQRAENELRAAGVRHPAGPRESARFEQLTPHEQQIASMVAAGLSNKEIGERLSVSHRTIGYHLYRMFPKLGITSRAELGTLLAEARVLRQAGAS